MRGQNKANPQTVWISQGPFKSGEVDQLMSADYVVHKLKSVFLLLTIKQLVVFMHWTGQRQWNSHYSSDITNGIQRCEEVKWFAKVIEQISGRARNRSGMLCFVLLCSNHRAMWLFRINSYLIIWCSKGKQKCEHRLNVI